MTNRFVGDRRGLHPLIYRRKAVSDSHEGYREPIFRKPAPRPKERDIYRADLKYKVPTAGYEVERESRTSTMFLFSGRSRLRVTILNSDHATRFVSRNSTSGGNNGACTPSQTTMMVCLFDWQ